MFDLSRRRAGLLVACALSLLACGGLGRAGGHGEDDTAVAAAPEGAPGFPTGYRRWPARDMVLDDGSATYWRSYKGPGARPDNRGRLPIGAVLVKESIVPGEDEVISRIDVRRRTADGPYGGWVYESFDPATRRPVDVDADTCDLCHQTAGPDGTFYFGAR